MDTRKVSEIVFRDDLYPRIEHNQTKAQEYAENIEKLPPILINQHNELIDGKHRWIAHQLANQDEIAISQTQTESDEHLLRLAISTNAKHGLQMSQADKKKMAVRLYAVGKRNAEKKKELAELLSVSVRAVTDWVADLDKAERKERREKIADLYLKCYTTEQIGKAVGLHKDTANDEVCRILEDLRKTVKVQFSEESWKPPIYNVWTYGKNTNKTKHFGNTEQRITENLLWLYTKPEDIVIDPFGGGGSTLNVCKARGRRCWISDRKPAPGMKEKIRTLDVIEQLPPLNKRWSDVSLVYLDPPYWAQAKGEYSEDPEDLANYESSDEFDSAMAGLIKKLAAKMRDGSHIAMIIQPTQWRAEEKRFTDHVFGIIQKASSEILIVENRISCPYSTEQCMPQMVEWAKENKKLLVLSRELVIWRIQK